MMRQLSTPDLPCRPPRWAASGYVQTILGNYWPTPPQQRPFRHLEVQLPDGDRLLVRSFAGGSKGVLCVFHGLGWARQLEVWTVNHRGCGSGRGLARGTYHSGVA